MGHNRLASPDLERIFEGETVSALSEWQLLARYLDHRDQLAFEALLARHGPMVMGTCRRMLAGQSDAEDAFQATFLVLVRRARSLGPRDAIGPWLHGVAAGLDASPFPGGPPPAKRASRRRPGEHPRPAVLDRRRSRGNPRSGSAPASRQVP